MQVAAAAVLRQGLRPQAQHALFVDGFGAQVTKTLAEGVDAHGREAKSGASVGTFGGTSGLLTSAARLKALAGR